MNAWTSPTFWRLPFESARRAVELELEAARRAARAITEAVDAAQAGEVGAELARSKAVVEAEVPGR